MDTERIEDIARQIDGARDRREVILVAGWVPSDHDPNTQTLEKQGLVSFVVDGVHALQNIGVCLITKRVPVLVADKIKRGRKCWFEVCVGDVRKVLEAAFHDVLGINHNTPKRRKRRWRRITFSPESVLSFVVNFSEKVGINGKLSVYQLPLLIKEHFACENHGDFMKPLLRERIISKVVRDGQKVGFYKLGEAALKLLKETEAEAQQKEPEATPRITTQENSSATEEQGRSEVSQENRSELEERISQAQARLNAEEVRLYDVVEQLQKELTQAKRDLHDIRQKRRGIEELL